MRGLVETPKNIAISTGDYGLYRINQISFPTGMYAHMTCFTCCLCLSFTDHNHRITSIRQMGTRIRSRAMHTPFFIA